MMICKCRDPRWFWYGSVSYDWLPGISLRTSDTKDVRTSYVKIRLVFLLGDGPWQHLGFVVSDLFAVFLTISNQTLRVGLIVHDLESLLLASETCRNAQKDSFLSSRCIPSKHAADNRVRFLSGWFPLASVSLLLLYYCVCTIVTFALLIRSFLLIVAWNCWDPKKS
jgi:hypothetical protein